jgi:hypothetical protein
MLIRSYGVLFSFSYNGYPLLVVGYLWYAMTKHFQTNSEAVHIVT